MLAFIVPLGDDKIFGSLLFQKDKNFKVYVSEGDEISEEYRDRLPMVSGGLAQVDEPFVCYLEKGALPDPKFVKRVLRTVKRHPDFDVYHVNPVALKDFPRKLSAAKLFKFTVTRAQRSPLSSFIFRTASLREKGVFGPDGNILTLASVLSCAMERPIRNVWNQRLEWTAPELPMDAASVEKRIMDRLDFYRWSELFFGDDDYPLDSSKRLEIICKEIARLYPAHETGELKEILATFQAAQGPIRKLRASSALKAALKVREQEIATA